MLFQVPDFILVGLLLVNGITLLVLRAVKAERDTTKSNYLYYHQLANLLASQSGFYHAFDRSYSPWAEPAVKHVHDIVAASKLTARRIAQLESQLKESRDAEIRTRDNFKVGVRALEEKLREAHRENARLREKLPARDRNGKFSHKRTDTRFEVRAPGSCIRSMERTGPSC